MKERERERERARERKREHEGERERELERGDWEGGEHLYLCRDARLFGCLPDYTDNN